jgi:hypothetical protein
MGMAAMTWGGGRRMAPAANTQPGASIVAVITAVGAHLSSPDSELGYYHGEIRTPPIASLSKATCFPCVDARRYDDYCRQQHPQTSRGACSFLTVTV